MTKTIGATPRKNEPQSLMLRVQTELLALLPSRIPYSAILFVGFTLLTLVSSLLVVYAAYENRQAYTQLQTLERRQLQYDVEWGQLILERSTLASPSRIEKIARDSLQMQLISPDQVRVMP